MSLAQLEKISLSDAEIKHVLHNIKHKVIEYPHLAKYKSLDELLKGIRAAVVLLEIDDDRTKSGHWISIIDRGHEIEYFDPYGFQPAQELSFTHEAPIILSMIKNTKKKVNVNNMKFQKFKHDINTCGRWSIIRVKHWKMSLHEFHRFIFENHLKLNPDEFVTYLTRGATDDRFAQSR